MDLQLTTPPASEPVTATEAKTECQIDFDTDDSLIADLITAARQMCENYCDSSFIEQTWTVQFELGQEEYHLPKGPHTSVTSVKNVYSDGTLSDALTAGSDYYLKGLSDYWIEPQTAYSLGTKELIGYRVVFVAGYSTLPEVINQAILKTVDHLYKGNTKMPFEAMQMLHPYRKTIVV